MSFYRDRIYPHIVTLLGNPEPIPKIRQQLIPMAHGAILEVGVGPGVNFPYYDPARVSKIYALEPNPGMVQRAENQRRQTELNVEFLDLPGERIPLPEASVDTVVSTFTLCTIPGVADAIRGIAGVLRPGGQFFFFEHGLSPDVRVRRWQERTEPFFHWAFEGCHVTRDIPALMDRDQHAPAPLSLYIANCSAHPVTSAFTNGTFATTAFFAQMDYNGSCTPRRYPKT